MTDNYKYKNLCEEGQEKWRFARGMKRNAGLHGKRFWAIQQTSNEAGQQLLNHIKDCKVCNK